MKDLETILILKSSLHSFELPCQVRVSGKKEVWVEEMETFFRSPLLIAFLNFKRSVVRINSDDNLYCTRATVTTMAHLHKDDGVDEMRLYENLRRGLPVQGTRARALLQEAGVPEGPCGMCKLDTFQKALSPAYQICVLSVDKPHMIIFKGPPADRVFEQILLMF